MPVRTRPHEDASFPSFPLSSSISSSSSSHPSYIPTRNKTGSFALTDQLPAPMLDRLSSLQARNSQTANAQGLNAELTWRPAYPAAMRPIDICSVPLNAVFELASRRKRLGNTSRASGCRCPTGAWTENCRSARNTEQWCVPSVSLTTCHRCSVRALNAWGYMLPGKRNPHRKQRGGKSPDKANNDTDKVSPSVSCKIKDGVEHALRFRQKRDKLC